MKSLIGLMTVLVSAIMLIGCEEPVIRIDKDTESVLTEIPLNAYFNTEFHENIIPDGHMDMPGPVCQLVQNGSGSDDEIGFFNISLSCCWSASNRVPGRSGGYLTDGTGNILYIRCKENLSLSDMADGFLADHQVICGSYEFAGGTGRFKEASGEGTIHCTVGNSGTIAVMSHHWQGTLKIRKSFITDRSGY
jgi:hypothetical protein